VRLKMMMTFSEIPWPFLKMTPNTEFFSVQRSSLTNLI